MKPVLKVKSRTVEIREPGAKEYVNEAVVQIKGSTYRAALILENEHVPLWATHRCIVSWNEPVEKLMKSFERYFTGTAELGCLMSERDEGREPSNNRSIVYTKLETDKNEHARYMSGSDYGYHVAKIPRGVYGEVSKIVEEVLELQDAEAQGVRIMTLVELSDLIGAIVGHLEKHWPELSLTDLIKMSEVTRRAFANKHRIPR